MRRAWGRDLSLFCGPLGRSFLLVQRPPFVEVAVPLIHQQGYFGFASGVELFKVKRNKGGPWRRDQKNFGLKLADRCGGQSVDYQSFLSCSAIDGF